MMGTTCHKRRQKRIDNASQVRKRGDSGRANSWSALCPAPAHLITNNSQHPQVTKVHAVQGQLRVDRALLLILLLLLLLKRNSHQRRALLLRVATQGETVKGDSKGQPKQTVAELTKWLAQRTLDQSKNLLPPSLHSREP